jgi:hypothetical protein
MAELRGWDGIENGTACPAVAVCCAKAFDGSDTAIPLARAALKSSGERCSRIG